MSRRRITQVLGYVTVTAILGALFPLLLGSSAAADRNGMILIAVAIPAGLTWLGLRILERRSRNQARPK